jgi:hypothetical protein
MQETLPHKQMAKASEARIMSSEISDILTITGFNSSDSPHSDPESVTPLLEQEQLPLQPVDYTEHECDPNCNLEIDLNSFRGCNPFAIPLLAGWR